MEFGNIFPGKPTGTCDFQAKNPQVTWIQICRYCSVLTNSSVPFWHDIYHQFFMALVAGVMREKVPDFF
jgi:hypothetical protein